MFSKSPPNTHIQSAAHSPPTFCPPSYIMDISSSPLSITGMLAEAECQKKVRAHALEFKTLVSLPRLPLPSGTGVGHLIPLNLSSLILKQNW